MEREISFVMGRDRGDLQDAINRFFKGHGSPRWQLVAVNPPSPVTKEWTAWIEYENT